MSVSEAVIGSLASDLELNEGSVALLRDIADHLSDAELARVAEVLATGERARHLRGWTEVSSGDTQGPWMTILGVVEALKIVVNKLPVGQSRLVYVLYTKGPKGAKA